MASSTSFSTRLSTQSIRDDDHDAAKQLKDGLQDFIKREHSVKTSRARLTHLNADTTWLLSLPIPTGQSSRLSNRSAKAYYHILIDPWLKGGQSDVAKFFSQQWHAIPSSVQTISDLEILINQIEAASNSEAGSDGKGADHSSSSKSNIDIVLISHEFTDHMHRETLLEIPGSVAVLATEKAADVIRSWKHFGYVGDIGRFDGDWRHSSTDPLPEWVGVSRVAYAGKDMLYYHSAIMVTFSLSGLPSDTSIEAEAIIYTPHGVTPENVAGVTMAKPKIKTLALLHGLQDISLGAQLNMGAHNGLKVQRLLRARYWIGTHDEVKKGGGIVSWFLKRKKITLKEAFEQEAQGGDRNEAAAVEDVRFEELESGETLILE